ncbi:MAG: acetolactate synthase small subunit [Acidipropionibacterium acidipropionici]|jgi:acetolactate synthase-1/3 small subunit|uniref:Acetolactate synthase small subunit n=1 Tax=Acidipropionibacterium acidipropionici (strain ATCC 4875 / DSM 20272 / JCM 6432 / NBRC 12425 / NCIMB 8070 / 4) TaxID=1171373 RepID=K7RU19_ACIA4|nr:acetolactate synthase small subunit [Acidipropionibacterium acidipropionici]AFV89856.1 Acetolactate synthase, small subunit [Acidipropionibacterium acidipropionici ATCC 4875]ALN15793.1 acetolactate synthase small subunit [Acidipropionibacterium acidipropionici]APZ08461.1 acetolactate synthase small subunit [Acidipropionibacterium acidipropionici]MDN6555472.1 acetolactate synthase small subunit [Acidipropionibacterium acidipropionici]
MTSTHILSVLVVNRPGVLTRVAGLFARRGYNIESLTVSPTNDPQVSRMTIGVDVDSPSTLEQIVKQLNKLIEVHKIIELEDSAVTRELVLVKVHSDLENRSKIVDTVGLFRGKAVDVSHESITIEATGGREKLEALIKMLEPFGILEIVQSGRVAVNRGASALAAKGSRNAS